MKQGEFILKSLTEDQYSYLHSDNLVPLDIKIDVDLFNKEMVQYTNLFKQWGDKFNDLPRYGLPLVNKNGKLDNDPEPACWPLDRWNFVKLGYEDTPEGFTQFYKDCQQDIGTDLFDLETSFTTPTEALNISSLDPLDDLKSYMVRSCILRWHKKAHFKPHYDTWHPVRWLRIWGTTKPNGMYLRFKSDDNTDGFCSWNETTKQHEIYKAEENIEAGRLYIIDTLKWHDALAFEDDVHQFFIALNVDSYELLFRNII